MHAAALGRSPVRPVQPAVLNYLLHTAIDPLRKGETEADEVGLPVVSNGLVLPCGAAGRWTADGI